MAGTPWSWTGLRGGQGRARAPPGTKGDPGTTLPPLARGIANVIPNVRHMDTYHMIGAVAVVGIFELTQINAARRLLDEPW